MTQANRILMVAAENDDLPGAKVGGVADVLRDLPSALIKQGYDVQCVIPSYGKLARLPNLDEMGFCTVVFSGVKEKVTLFKRAGKKNKPDIFILHSSRFTPQGETVYCHDKSDRPFATDSTKFAFFSAAIASCLQQGLIARPDILHCHDWHTAFLLILIRFSPEFENLKPIKTVYSIHNLAMQGVRPLSGDASSFEAWFPNLNVELRDVVDPHVPHCINPMRAGILLADKVHTVSPTYAKEILLPSDHEKGIYGGEGLERDLQTRSEKGDLTGILNGCEYPRATKAKKIQSKAALVKSLERAIITAASSNRELLSAHWIADKRLKQWGQKKKSDMVLTSVGRITEQKARLFTTEVEPGVSALSLLLESLSTHGVFIMIGSGDSDIEHKLVAESAQHDNFIFINGFVPEVVDSLYAQGDLFIMPSSFEPCGISQLLAMRSGQPCLVNRVGGLRDTVVPNKTGFAFEGEDATEQAKAMIDTFEEALRVFTTSDDIWADICKAASKVRFTWEHAAKEYIAHLYAY